MPEPLPRDLHHTYLDHVIQGIKLQYGEGGVKSINPCEIIDDPDLEVGILSNGVLKPDRFLIHGTDTNPILLEIDGSDDRFRLDFPGKSAFLYFGGQPSRQHVDILARMALQRNADRRDKLHLASVGRINHAGWQVFWTPLPKRNNWDHVRLVPNSIIETNRRPNLVEAGQLSSIFVKAV